MVMGKIQHCIRFPLVTTSPSNIVLTLCSLELKETHLNSGEYLLDPGFYNMRTLYQCSFI